MKSCIQKLSRESTTAYLKETKYCLKQIYHDKFAEEKNILVPTVQYLKNSNAPWSTRIDILSSIFPKQKFNIYDLKTELENQKLIQKNLDFSSTNKIDTQDSSGRFMTIQELYTLSALKSTYVEIDKIIFYTPQDSQSKNYLDTKQPISDGRIYIGPSSRAIDVKSSKIEQKQKSILLHSYYDKKTNSFIGGPLNETTYVPDYIEQNKKFFRAQSARLDQSDPVDRQIFSLINPFLEGNSHHISTVNRLNHTKLAIIKLDTDRRFLSEIVVWEHKKSQPSDQEQISHKMYQKFIHIDFFDRLPTRGNYLNHFSRIETPEIIKSVKSKPQWKPSMLSEKEKQNWSSSHLDNIDI